MTQFENRIWMLAFAVWGIIGIVFLVVGATNMPVDVPAPTVKESLSVEPYVVPDPCGLEVVVCDGEVEKPITPYVRPAYRIVTAYSSEVGQTDASPCIAADGSDICKRAAAGETL